MAALPAPWETRVSKSSGDTYYFNPGTGVSTYDFPSATAGAQVAAPPSLPAPWQTRISQSSGDTYYFNPETEESTYDFPYAAAKSPRRRSPREMLGCAARTPRAVSPQKQQQPVALLLQPQPQQQVAQQATRAGEAGGLSSRMAAVEESLRSGNATSPRSAKGQDTDSYSEHSSDSDHDSLDSREQRSGGDALHLSPRHRHDGSRRRRHRRRHRRYDDAFSSSPVLGRGLGGSGGVLTVQVRERHVIVEAPCSPPASDCRRG
jgi:hypothetical protein